MSELGTAAAWLVASVLGWAAVAKLRRPQLTARSFASLGLPSATTLAVVVPVVELILAAGLILLPQVAALGAVVLLSAFTAMLVVLMRRPEPIACGCFGSTASTPVGPADLVRNGGLLLAAAMALWSEGGAMPSLPGAITATSAAAALHMAVGLVRLRGELGVVWDNTLPGEVRAA